MKKLENYFLQLMKFERDSRDYLYNTVNTWAEERCKYRTSRKSNNQKSTTDSMMSSLSKDTD